MSMRVAFIISRTTSAGSIPFRYPGAMSCSWVSPMKKKTLFLSFGTTWENASIWVTTNSLGGSDFPVTLHCTWSPSPEKHCHSLSYVHWRYLVTCPPGMPLPSIWYHGAVCQSEDIKTTTLSVSPLIPIFPPDRFKGRFREGKRAPFISSVHTPQVYRQKPFAVRLLHLAAFGVSPKSSPHVDGNLWPSGKRSSQLYFPRKLSISSSKSISSLRACRPSLRASRTRNATQSTNEDG
mmetsp:Transcript_25397/g.61175  ORF Transcript_25397/g.61175 Transcript_25397/m.61175 type:complete len:236 (-) Transcript_25397:373-1080(-)